MRVNEERTETGSRLIAKLLRLTQQNKIVWKIDNGPPEPKIKDHPTYAEVDLTGRVFVATSGDLIFELGFSCNLPRVTGTSYPFLPWRDSGAIIYVLDRTRANAAIDIFTENDGLPILRSLHDMVYEMLVRADPNYSKIDAFLEKEPTHAQ